MSVGLHSINEGCRALLDDHRRGDRSCPKPKINPQNVLIFIIQYKLLHTVPHQQNS